MGDNVHAFSHRVSGAPGEDKEFKLRVSVEEREVTCAPEEVRIDRHNVGIIFVLLDEKTASSYEMLPLIFDGD